MLALCLSFLVALVDQIHSPRLKKRERGKDDPYVCFDWLSEHTDCVLCYRGRQEWKSLKLSLSLSALSADLLFRSIADSLPILSFFFLVPFSFSPHMNANCCCECVFRCLCPSASSKSDEAGKIWEIGGEKTEGGKSKGRGRGITQQPMVRGREWHTKEGGFGQRESGIGWEIFFLSYCDSQTLWVREWG